MQHILGISRRCIEDYNMIQANEKIAVGISGGKDSLVTLLVLSRLKEFLPVTFELEAITLDMGLPGMDFSGIKTFCNEIKVPYTIIKEPIYDIVFNERKEKNPCSLCAKMRRGSLNTTLIEKGINKIALGHHYDDAVETMLMNLIYEGRISCFQPVTYLDRTKITQIRPLLYCREEEIARLAAQLQLPVVESKCPADGNTSRQEVKDLLLNLEEKYPDIHNRIFGAMQRYPLQGWKVEDSI